MSRGPLVAIYRLFRDWVQGRELHERQLALAGAQLARDVKRVTYVQSLHEVEFRVFSQWGDDGIIQWLIGRVPGIPKRFVEFGVEDFSESNCRFLMVNDFWSGLVMDGSNRNITRLRSRPWYWRHDLAAIPLFVTAENVESAIDGWASGREIGILHIDVDGNDYWLWQAVQCISPYIVIMEYNGVFGAERAITVPYDPSFDRIRAHHSGQYAGASLAALAALGAQKGYALVGTNSAGNNAYFLRRDLLGDGLEERTVGEAFTEPVFRESRDRRGRLDFRSIEQRRETIRGLPVWNVMTGQIEPF